MSGEKKIVIIAGREASGNRHGRQQMSERPQGSKDPDILAAPKALRRAARRALELGLRTGTPVYVLRKGRLVDLAAEHNSKRGRKRSTASRRPS